MREIKRRKLRSLALEGMLCVVPPMPLAAKPTLVAEGAGQEADA